MVVSSAVDATVAEPAAEHGPRGVFFVVEPNRAGLAELAARIDAGELRPVVGEALSLERGREAFERKRAGGVPTVIAVTGSGVVAHRVVVVVGGFGGLHAVRKLRFVVVGAGPTGVELAGQIGELARDTLRRDFRTIDTRAARILLVDLVDRVLPQFPPRLSKRAAVICAPSESCRCSAVESSGSPRRASPSRRRPAQATASQRRR